MYVVLHMVPYLPAVRSLGQQHIPLHVLDKNRRNPDEFSHSPLSNRCEILMAKYFRSCDFLFKNLRNYKRHASCGFVVPVQTSKYGRGTAAPNSSELLVR